MDVALRENCFHNELNGRTNAAYDAISGAVSVDASAA